MNPDQGGDSETRFAEYVAGVGSVLGHVERTRPLRDYCTGLTLPGERKSVEPMAARTAPARTAAQPQSLLHFVANATWSDGDVRAKVREMVLPAIEKSGPVEAWIIDDTSFPKQGKPSVGVGVAGVASTITQPCASRPTASSSPNRRPFPAPDLVPPRQSRSLSIPDNYRPGGSAVAA